MKELVRLIATGAYSGYFPFVAGTIGTIPAWFIAWFFLGNPTILVIVALLTILISVWASGQAESFLGHDAKKIVIDEWAGMFVTVLFLPHRLDVYIAAFLFFRFFDVIKPYPSGKAESWKGGWGITFDDIFAGVYANLLCQIGVYLLGRLNWLGF